jgi:hypothetical protein
MMWQRRPQGPPVNRPLPVASATDALAVIYTADRQQAAATISTISNVAVAVATYIGATGAFVLATDKGFNHQWSYLALPAPAWMLAFFHLILFSMTAARTRSILALENLMLAEDLRLRPITNIVGQRGEERLTNGFIQPFALRPAGTVVFLAYPLLLGGYTEICCTEAVQHGGWSAQAISAIVIYSLFVVFVVCASRPLMAALRDSARRAAESVPHQVPARDP